VKDPVAGQLLLWFDAQPIQVTGKKAFSFRVHGERMDGWEKMDAE
jgi:hypothetical protein